MRRRGCATSTISARSIGGHRVARLMQNTPDRAVADQIEEKQRTFVSRDAHEALIDQMAGVVLKKLSGWSARIAGQDLCQRREAEAVLREMRTELAKVRQEMAGKRGEPPLDAGRLVCVTAHCVAEEQQPIRKQNCTRHRHNCGNPGEDCALLLLLRLGILPPASQ